MEPIRQPFQGVWNIIRFNWHFYLLSFILIAFIISLNGFVNGPYLIYTNIFCALVIATTLVSLFISFYVYDVSDLYKLNWLDTLTIEPNSKIANINAGFDETSTLLKHKYPTAELLVFDFYDPAKHTEVSIKRAREAYSPYTNTQQITTSVLPVQDSYMNRIFVILSAHEIRNDDERVVFFKELKRSLKPDGQIVVTEHLRDLSNFLAYNIGFFHFISKASWKKTFTNAGLTICKEINITPFITTFILEKNGAAT